jgi:type VI protein secretion system component VasK
LKGSQTRTTLLVLAGAYLLYLAWEMLNTMRKGETEMQPWLSIVFIVFFTLAGLGVFVLAWRARRQEKEQQETEKKDGSREDETHLTKG